MLHKLNLVAAFVIIAAVAGCGKAQAGGYVYSSACDSYGNCSSYYGPRTYDNTARIIIVPKHLQTDPTVSAKDWGKACSSCVNLTGDK